jgi:hypothetical protein
MGWEHIQRKGGILVEVIRVFFDPSDLSLIYDSKGKVYKRGYTKFFRKTRRILKARGRKK